MKTLFAILAALALSTSAHALTAAQIVILKSAALADPAVVACNTVGDDVCISNWFNAATTCVVWRSSLTENEITDDTSAELTNWSWTTYIGRSVAERDGWGRMMRNGSINPSKANVRAAITDIFSGTATAPVAQRAHITAMSKRTANRAEQLLSSGACTSASPSNLGFEGTISPAEAGTILRN